MEMKPEGDKVVVIPDAVEEKTKGGIYLPDQSKDRERRNTFRGEVSGIGPSVTLLFDEGRKLAIGDRVIFAKHGWFEVDEGDVKYWIMKEDDILALEK